MVGATGAGAPATPATGTLVVVEKFAFPSRISVATPISAADNTNIANDPKDLPIASFANQPQIAPMTTIVTTTIQTMKK